MVKQHKAKHSIRFCAATLFILLAISLSSVLTYADNCAEVIANLTAGPTIATSNMTCQ